MNSTISRVSTATAAALAGLAMATPAAAQSFEQPPTLRASEVLPANLLRGPHHTVDETVQNDGVLNRYTLRIPQGDLSVVGTDRLEIWIAESNALQQMDEVRRGKVFSEALGRSVKAPLKLAGDMVTDPIDTVGNVGEGIGSFFNSVGHSLFGGASDEEAGTVETAVGYDVIKRQFAFQFGVDPYTTNPLVQERLVELSRAAFIGGVPMKVATAAMPAAAGLTIRATGGAYGLSQLIRDKSPAELKQINGNKLAKMGVPQQTMTRFLEHPDYSPTKKTIIAHVLANMPGVADRTAFFEVASSANDEPMAFVYQEQAEGLAAYHARVAPLVRLMSLRGLVLGQRADGVVVGVFPVDYVTWKQRSADRTAGLKQDLARLGATGQEMWVGGRVSPLFRQNVTAAGWTLQENARDKLQP